MVESGSVLVPDRLRRVPWMAGAAAAVCLGLAFGTARTPADVLPAYAVAWLFFLSLALGALFFVLFHFATRAGWSVSIRRWAEHVMATIPVLALLAIPLGQRLDVIYPWARGERSTAAMPDFQDTYLQPGFFLARAAAYLALWSVMAWWFRRGSLLQDESGDPAVTRRLQRASPPAIVLLAVTVTLAALDWIMSAQHGWYSTMFGVYYFAGCIVGFLALLAVALAFLRERQVSGYAIHPGHLHDVGKLLFGFTCFWAYIAFSQFMLIWYANLPEETIYYGVRLEPGWIWVSRLLAVGHFIVPFFVLLSEDLKRTPRLLGAAGLWMLAMHYLDLYWLVLPALRAGAAPQWVDLGTVAGVGFVFAGTLAILLRRGAAIPIGDPRLPESLVVEHA